MEKYILKNKNTIAQQPFLAIANIWVTSTISFAIIFILAENMQFRSSQLTRSVGTLKAKFMNMDIQTILSILSIIVNIIGFYFVIRQITQQALATRGETYTSLCGLSYEILKLIHDNPYLYDYFYNNKKLEESSDHKVQVLMCCEMIANYCDNVTLQRENIPNHVWQRWKNFILGQLETSIELKKFMLEYKEWYSPEMITILNEADK